jgi:hypothetical protein
MTREDAVRFPIRFDGAFGALSWAVLLPPSGAFVELGGGEVRVRMGWAFRARFPASAIVSVGPYRRVRLTRGVHGWAGRWLVNGSGDGILDLALSPEQRACVMGLPVRLRHLLVSVEDPAGVRAALAR